MLKQNAGAIYEAFNKATRDDSAYAIFKGAEPVAKVFIRYGGRSSPHGLTVRAYVHVLGLPMVRGTAKGGGYDMKSAAVLDAGRYLPANAAGRDSLPLLAITALTDIRELIDSGQTWDRQLQELGYTVFQVV